MAFKDSYSPTRHVSDIINLVEQKPRIKRRAAVMVLSFEVSLEPTFRNIKCRASREINVERQMLAAGCGLPWETVTDRKGRTI